jgi:hypothetical protein
VRVSTSLSLFLIGLGALCLSCSFIVPFSHFLPAWRHWDGTCLIEPDKSNSTSINIFWGAEIEGMLVISGDNNEIYFSLTDSQEGNSIVSGTASERHYFGPFLISKNANYTLTFDNNMSAGTTMCVYWIVWAYWYRLAFQILGIWTLTIGTLILLYGTERRKA